ncbi:hypothetical protein LIER_20191 [Lithospermum erythrorhizon]|uniref:G protein gamma domain-containing protein n=1 Tax=Lithospermum erythrorhizon TaxID=34254 RepID=A0AAV3QNM0_LITER
MQSQGVEQIRSLEVTTDSKGKQRISAELKRVEQETKFLEEELEQLNEMEKASEACKELVAHTEARPDPLLPQTSGPDNPFWDRWFEGPKKSSRCKCWIF